MSRMQLFNSIILLFVGAISVFGQSDFRRGYLITNNYDTIPGLIDYRGDSRNMNLCVYKANEESKPEIFNAKQIKGYRFEIEGRYFVSRYVSTQVVKDTVFLEFLVDGIADLYYYQNNQLYQAYFVESAKGELMEIVKLPDAIEVVNGVKYSKKDYSYFANLSYAFADCMDLIKDLRKIDVNHKSLIAVTKKYHEYKCTDEACIVYEKTIKPISVKFSPVIGYSFVSIKFIEDKFTKYDFRNSHSFLFGVNADISMPRISEKMKLIYGSHIRRDYFYGVDNGTYAGSINTEEASYYDDCHLHRFNWINEFSVKYTYPKGKYRPTFIGGGFFKTVLSENSHQIREVKYSNEVTISNFKEPSQRRGIVGFIGGTGIEMPLKGKVLGYTQLSYSLGASLLGGYGNKEVNGAISLTSGIYF